MQDKNYQYEANRIRNIQMKFRSTEAEKNAIKKNMEAAGKKIPPEEVKKLLTNGRTKLIKGFHSSKGNSFDAYLILKEDKTIGFSFPEKKKTRKNLK